jgi:hypothetical protein
MAEHIRNSNGDEMFTRRRPMRRSGIDPELTFH